MSARDFPLSQCSLAPLSEFSSLLAESAGPRVSVDGHARVEPGSVLGHGCRVMSGAVVARGTRLGSGVQVGHNAVFLAAEGAGAGTVVGDGAVIGANAVVHAGLSIGAGAQVRPGAVVQRAVPPGAVVEGNPALVTGWCDGGDGAAADGGAHGGVYGVVPTLLAGVTLHGVSGGDIAREFPFVPRRWRAVLGRPGFEGAERGARQFIVCVRGSCTVTADDGSQRIEVALVGARQGLHLPPLTWLRCQPSPDAVVLVFASDDADPLTRRAQRAGLVGTPS